MMIGIGNDRTVLTWDTGYGIWDFQVVDQSCHVIMAEHVVNSKEPVCVSIYMYCTSNFVHVGSV